jgi:hypothetical protein
MKADISAALAQWYADNAAIRRLRAVEAAVGLVVLVTLEPTSDGDDTLPIWLANRREWSDHLTRLTRREVQLLPVTANEYEGSPVDSGAVTIAELGWRDFWS